MLSLAGPVFETVVNLIRSYAQTPEQKVEAERAIGQLEIDFIKATAPDPSRVYVWANTLIALVRPVISLLIVGAMVFAPARLLALVRGFADAGPSGWIVLAPVLWWFFGRDVSKFLAIRTGGILAVGSGAPTNGQEQPAPDTSAGRFRRTGPERD